MNNEILEISQWLHEKGFECDWWEMDGVLYPEQEAEYEICNPYFTLNRALELLPLMLGSKGNPEAPYMLMISKRAIGYSVASGGHRSALGFHFSGDLHLSALRLLKKTVEEGYVKAN